MHSQHIPPPEPRAPRRREIKAARAKGQTQKPSRPARRAGKRRAKTRAWWSAPVTAATICLLAAVLVFTGGALSRWRNFSLARAQVEKDTFYPGVTVDGTDLSDMTLDAALAAWAQAAARQSAACQVELHIDGESWILTAEDAGFSSDYAQVLSSAYAVGRYGTFSQRSQAVAKAAGAWGRDYATHSGCDEARLRARLEAIATQVSQPATEATITGFSEEGGFTFSQGTEGLVADVHELTDAVLAAIASGGGQVSYARKAVGAGRTVDDLQKLFGLVSQAKTSARSSSRNRLTNLKLACEALNGLRVEPGEVFSYNDTLGKRTEEKGYKNAPALSSGSHTMQIGGGICQVSTTLFNAVAKAGLKIVKRYPHSIPSSYVARGLDATVNWPNQDFQFQNTSDYPVYLSARLTSGKEVLVSVYGRLLDEGVTIKLKAITNESIDPGEPVVTYTADLPAGQQQWISDRRMGYKVATYRVFYKDGAETERELLFRSNYAASRGKVRVGQ